MGGLMNNADNTDYLDPDGFANDGFIDLPCDDCGAEPGEPCRPYCTGEAAYKEAKETNESP